MTETEWVACSEPLAMLEWHRERMSNRKLRLFVVACSRQVWDSLCVEAVRTAVEVNERFADKQATSQDLSKVRNAAHGPAHDAWSDCRRTGQPTEETVRRLFFAVFMAQESQQLRAASMHRLRDDPILAQIAPALLRDIFGNPFRPISFDPAWRTSDVMLLAQGIYDAKAFDLMPILADALQDAGCDNDDILAHCRTEQTHVRGCWVVDLVLGKE